MLTSSWSKCPLAPRDGEGVRGSASSRRSSVWSRFCTCTHNTQAKKRTDGVSTRPRAVGTSPVSPSPLLGSSTSKLQTLDLRIQIFESFRYLPVQSGVRRGASAALPNIRWPLAPLPHVRSAGSLAAASFPLPSYSGRCLCPRLSSRRRDTCPPPMAPHDQEDERRETRERRGGERACKPLGRLT